MRLDLIKEALSYDIPDEAKEMLILRALAKDENVIPKVLKILEIEREEKATLTKEMNVELSRAHVYIDQHEIKHKIGGADKGFIIDKISKFYIKYKGVISHSFNRFN